MRSFLKRLDMIKLKSEVNKSQIMRELKEEAKNMYDNAYEGENAIEQFLLGAESLFKKLRIGAVMRSRFNKGDIVICWLKGGSYGDKFTVLEDTGGLTLLCHKTGGLCIVNNCEDYDFA
jgi:hypothetical protein